MLCLLLLFLVISLIGNQATGAAILKTGDYITEYEVFCDAQSTDWTDLPCSKKGSDYTFAVANTKNVSDLIASLITENTWLGACEENKDGYQWTWVDTPRQASIRFGVSSSCNSTASYCNYEGGRPADAKDCGNGYNDYLMMKPNGKWRDVSLFVPDVYYGGTDCYQVKCYACQRSPCVIADRCVVNNTKSVYGYLSMTYPYQGKYKISDGVVGTEGCICQCKDGYGGDRCQYSLLDSNSTYQVTCNNASSISITEAQDACKGLGSGWTLGTMSSNKVKEYTRNNTTSAVWLAGYYMNDTENWAWNTGRRTNQPITFENWASDYPSKCDAFLSHQVFLGTDNESKFIGLLANSTCDNSTDNETGTTPHCALCEYQPCIIDLDCTPNSTIAVSGHYGNCRCICEEGWGGSRCSVTNIVESDGYNTSYSIFCNDQTCSQNGMVDATIPNENVNNVLQKMLAASEESMLKLAVKKTGSTLSWKNAIRRSDNDFWTSSGCVEGAYCNFDATASHSSTGYTVMLANGTWNITNDYTTKCYACEKSLCQLDIDCFKPGAISVSGYYPNCICQCKEGYSGFQCATFKFHINTTDHLSNYTAMCEDPLEPYRPLSLVAAGSRCSTNEAGFLATMNDNETLVAFLEKINGTEDDTFWWLGGSSSSAEPNKWYWDTGRLNHTLFYDGTSTISDSANWTTGYPLNNNSENIPNCPSGSRQDALIIGKDGQWRNVYSNIKCNSYAMQPHCVLCEQPLCVLELDCEINNTLAVSGIYGKCLCQCKDGWGGKRCDVRAIIYNETYYTEYVIKCSNSEITYKWSAGYQCRNVGDGWALAGVPNVAVNDLLKTMVSKPVWIAAEHSYSYSARAYLWMWDGDIRSAGAFGKPAGYGYGYGAIECIEGVYCNIDSTSTCRGYNMAMDSNGMWYRFNSYSSCEIPSCVVCERSPCNITEDCFSHGTLNVTGWYPSCTCLCKPGFTGTLCDRVLFNATNDNYTSMYQLKCQKDRYSVEEAKAYCRSLGAQYNLATLPTANASNAFIERTNTTSFHFWLGAHSVNGTWTWTTGRQTGVALSDGYTNWKDGRPRSGDTCTDENSSWLVVESPDGNWSDEYSNGSECTSSITQCVACEALPCELHVDCNETNTLSVEGYFGDCHCHCAEGWGGPTCSIVNVINSSTYSTEYTVSCSTRPIEGYNIQYTCDYRNGWTPASVPSSDVHELLMQLVNADENTWIGGQRGSTYDDTGEYTIIWKWGYGRMKNTVFANSSNCTTSPCYFPPGRPTTKYECVYNYYYSTVNNMVVMFPNGTWHDRYTQQRSTKGPGCVPTRCVACERSPCSAIADCNPDGTINATGWYPPSYYSPSCTCHCKPGYKGERCEIYLVQNNNYVSEYKLVCDNKPMGRYSASQKCNEENEGWFVATTPTKNATDAIEILSSMYDENATNHIWLSGSDQYIEGDWAWREGRLKGSPIGDNYSLWAPGRPTNGTGTSCNGEMTDFLVLVNKSVWEDTYYYKSYYYSAYKYQDCPVPPRCTACERQPCIMELDCDPNHTEIVSGWFPSCICKCRSGWAGDRCDVNNVVEHLNYVSEYNLVCDSYKSCSSLDGDGWNLASVPSAKANELLSKLSSKGILLGATLRSNDNRWIWNTGRQKGVAFAVGATSDSVGSKIPDVYSNWQTGQPKYTCTNYNYNYYRNNRVVILSGETNSSRLWASTWKSTYSSFSGCSSFSCNACERSPCTIAADCTVNKTESVSGYYPNCKCKCKFGYAGEDCSYDGNYYELRSGGGKDYYALFVDCSAYQTLTYVSAIHMCSSLGQGWTLATPQSMGYWLKLKNLVSERLTGLNIQSRVWLGGEKEAGKWEWKYGRYNGKEIKVDQCASYQADSFCAWSQTGDDDLCFAADRIVMQNDGTWAKTVPGYSIGSSCGNTPKCYACQQSNCTMDADCDRTHALNVSGMYPECVCECEAGWGGARCETRVCHVLTDCRNLSDTVTGTWPHCYCTGCPKGRGPWGCATLTATLPLEPIISRTVTRTSSRTIKRQMPFTKSTTVASTDNNTNETTDDNETTLDTIMTNSTEEPSSDNMTTESIIPTTEGNTTTATNTTTDTTSDATTIVSDTTSTTEMSTTEADSSVVSNITELPTDISTITSTTTPTTTATEYDCLWHSETAKCLKKENGYMLEPLLESFPSTLSADALQSIGTINITVSIRNDSDITTLSNPRGYFANVTTNERILNVLVYNVVINPGSIIFTVASQNVQNGEAYLYLESPDIIQRCCRSTVQHHRFGEASSNDGLRLCNIKLEAAKVITSAEEDKSQQEVLQNNAGERELITDSVSYGCEVLYGKPNNDAVLRALSPVALLVATDDGYSGIIYSNLIVIVIVLVIHFIVVLIQRARTHCPFSEVCASLSFPSMPLYVIYALLPGTAIASGELTARGNGLGVVAMLFTLGIILNACLYPYMYLSRGLYSVPLLEEKQRSAGYSLIFPTTIVAPPAVAASYGALVNNYRFPSPVWPTLPLWSSLILLILALIQPTSTTACTVIYVIMSVIHMIIILVVMVIRPHTSLLLDVAYCLGIVPVVLLGATRATSADDASYAMLILLAAVNALRLGAAFCSPFKTFRLASYENITHESPIWVFNSKCGKEFEGFSDLETAMFTFKEDDHYADPSLMFKDNMSSVSGQSGQPGSVVDMPYTPPNRTHTLAPGGNSDHHSASERSPGLLSPDKGSAVGSEVEQPRITNGDNDTNNENNNDNVSGTGTVEDAPKPEANGDEDPFE